MFLYSMSPLEQDYPEAKFTHHIKYQQQRKNEYLIIFLYFNKNSTKKIVGNGKITQEYINNKHGKISHQIRS